MKFKYTHNQLIALRDLIAFSYSLVTKLPKDFFEERSGFYKFLFHLGNQLLYNYLFKLSKKLIKQNEGYTITIPNEVLYFFNAFAPVLEKLLESDLQQALLREILAESEQRFNSPPKPLHT